jgi:RND superfamily putative drug exporter
MMVQSDPAGLPDSVARTAADRATTLAQNENGPLLAAFPVPGDSRLPGVRQPGTTIVTYLYPRPDQGFAAAVGSARAYAAGFAPSDRVVGVTGSVPARVEQERLIASSLPVLESVSAIAVLFIVGLAFRSLVAPLLTLATAGLSFVLVTRVGGLLAQHLGLRIPADLEPLMVALMLGVTTDYVVYMLAGMRTELARGHDPRSAARRACATFLPILVMAGVTICAGVSTLLLACSPVIRAFGPAMALSVLVALVVAVTVLPAAMAILGRVAFWPSRPESGRSDGGRHRRGTVRLRQSRELAFAPALGILLDALVVRTVLVPALLGLFGRFSGWPGRRLDRDRTGRLDTG